MLGARLDFQRLVISILAASRIRVTIPLQSGGKRSMSMLRINKAGEGEVIMISEIVQNTFFQKLVRCLHDQKIGLS